MKFFKTFFFHFFDFFFQILWYAVPQKSVQKDAKSRKSVREIGQNHKKSAIIKKNCQNVVKKLAKIENELVQTFYNAFQALYRLSNFIYLASTCAKGRKMAKMPPRK